MEVPRTIVVDDEPAIRGMIGEWLRRQNFPVTAFPSAESFRSTPLLDEPHVLIIDKNLPGMSGIELVKQHRLEGRPFEAIVITGYGDTDSAVEALELGCYAYMRKPFQLKELFTNVAGARERLLSGQTKQQIAAAIPALTLGAALRRLAQELEVPASRLEAELQVFSDNLPGAVLAAQSGRVERLRESVGRVRRIGELLRSFAGFDLNQVATTTRQVIDNAVAAAQQTADVDASRIVVEEDGLPLSLPHAPRATAILSNLLVQALGATGGGDEIHLRATGTNGGLKLDVSHRDFGAPTTESGMRLTLCHVMAVALGGKLTIDRSSMGIVHLGVWLPAPDGPAQATTDVLPAVG